MENYVWEIDERFRRLHERYYDLLIVIVTSVVIAYLINILAPPASVLIRTFAQRIGVNEALIYTGMVFLLIICIFLIGRFYYGKPIIVRIGTFLLLDRNSAVIYPVHSMIAEYSLIGTLALQAYLREAKNFQFPKAGFSLKDPLLRDLLELFLVDWLVSTTTHRTELLSSGYKPKIEYPRIGKRQSAFKTKDILAKFGENRFTKYLERDNLAITLSEIKLPEKFTVKCQRYQEGEIHLSPNEEPLRVPLASELRIEGSLLVPLRRLRIISYISGIAPGEAWILRLERKFNHVTIGPDAIECIDRLGNRIVIRGEERKKLSAWVKIDFDVIVVVEMKSFLFWNPKFGQVLDWARKMCLRAIDYFTPRFNILKL